MTTDSEGFVFDFDFDNKIGVHVAHESYHHHVIVEMHFDDGAVMDYTYEDYLREGAIIAKTAKDVFKKLV